jgi:hypothetical protein
MSWWLRAMPDSTGAGTYGRGREEAAATRFILDSSFRGCSKSVRLSRRCLETPVAGTSLAFALAGLGGFNAHGAGFLQAARDNEIEPDLVTATSGQIVVLAAYLKGATDLKKGLIDKALEDNPFAQLRIALLGYPGVFEPAVTEAVARILALPYLGIGIDFFANRFLPAQLYKPTRTVETIEELADTFNDSHMSPRR